MAANAKLSDVQGLRNYLGIFNKMPVMLLQNLWQRAGLVNGSMGKVRQVVWDDDTTLKVPAFVVIEFEGYRGPAFEGWPAHWDKEVDRTKWVPIPASSVYLCDKHARPDEISHVRYMLNTDVL